MDWKASLQAWLCPRRIQFRYLTMYPMKRFLRGNSSLVTLLQSCKSFNQALQVHAQMVLNGLCDDIFTLSRLISSFALLGSEDGLIHSRNLFSQIDNPNVFIWNTMMRGYSRSNSPHEALLLYMSMLSKGIESPNNFTYPFVLNSCARLSSRKPGYQVHCHVIQFGFEFDLYIRNALIHLYSVFGHINDARKVFERSLVRDIVSYNTMINGYTQVKQPCAALWLFREMQDSDIRPDGFTLVALLSACSVLNDPRIGKWIHALVYKYLVYIDSNMLLNSAVIDMYAKCGLMNMAERVFSTMRTKNTAAWSCMVSGYTRVGEVETARRLFDQMEQRDVVSWTAMISGYSQAGQFTEALELFGQMEYMSIQPDEVTLVAVFSACAGLGALDFGKRVLRKYIENVMLGRNVFLTTALIDMYAKCGSIESALDVFNRIPNDLKTVSLFNSTVSGLAQHGLGKTAIAIFREMESMGPRPDGVTFVGILCACSHSGLVDEGQKLLELEPDHGARQSILRYMEIDKAIRESGDQRLKTKYNNAIYVIQRALALYSIEEVAFSFNGGKDSTVLLHLLRAGYFLHKGEQSCSNGGLTDFPVRTIYFESSSAFTEINSFTYDIASLYGLQLDIIRTDFKSGLEALLKAKPIRAIFLGVRIGDPTAVGQEQFSPSSPGWPPFMRVNPILDWSYRDVWAFILTCKVQYCSLYDQGYTSIGSIHDTVPNALLCISDSSSSKEKFKPAYLLSDGRLERAGRVKKTSPSVRGRSPTVANGMDIVDSKKHGMLTASVIAVGDEILSGTVEDQLGPSLCKKLHSIGWSVTQTAVVRNDVDSVAEEVERRKSANNMVFIYGGVGPLHSDVTSAGVAKAFGVRLAPDEEFEEYLRHFIGDHCTGDRNEMAQLPEGITELFHHEQLPVPLIKCQNVIILAATNITELDKEWTCLLELLGSNDSLALMEPFTSKSLSTNLPDIEVAQPLSKLCLEFPDLHIGSYRKSRQGILVISFEGKDQARIDSARESLCKKFRARAFSETV
ncbi:hypothetical protein QYF36_014729 [Acer negundo]|nr:hypothetical protein QYF36_014729 [Acer negundo]